MKKIRLTFLMLMAFMMSLAAFGQSTLTVHDGTVTNSNVPMYVSYFDDFTRAHVVYPASELEDMNGAQISAITFYCSSDNMPYTTVSTVDLYMTEVAQEGVSAFIDKSTATMVYQGTVNFEQTADGGEATIIFDTPYTYNGGNLLFGCDNTTDAGYKFVYFYGETVNGASYSGYNSSSLEGVTSGSQRNFLPKTTFTYSGATPVACPKPTGLAYSNVTANSVELSWTAGGSESEWTLEVNGTEMTGITTNPYTLTVNPATNYTVKVKANCSATEVSTWSNTVSFTTPCTDITTLPWMVDFEGFTASTVPMCWDNSASATSTVTSNPERVWGVYAYDGNQMLRMYNFYVQNGVALINTPTIVLPSSETYALSFKYSHLANCGAFTVSISNDGGATFTEIGSYEATTTSYNYTDPGTFTQVAPISLGEYAGQSIIVQFKATSNYGSGAIFVDDVNIDLAPSCMIPSSLTAGDITTNSAVISWSAGGTETEWTLEVNGEEIANVTENPYPLEGLTPATNYSVRVKANCSEESSSDWSTAITFNTSCVSVVVTDDDPFVEDFNTLTEGIPTCWDNSEGTTTNDSYKWNYYATGATGACVRFNSYYNSTDNTNMLKTPVMDVTAVTNPMLSFNYKNPTGGDFSVFVSTDGGATYTTALATGLTGVSDWTMMEIALDNLAATDQVVIVFAGTSNCGYGDAYTYLDDVRVGKTPTCLRPTDVEVNNITTTSATIAWTDNNTTAPQSWVIDLNGTEYDADTNPFTIETLTASTSYTVKVKAICTDDDESDWSDEVTFSTACGTIVVTEENPYNEGFEGADFGCWSTQVLSGSYDWILTTQYAAVGTQSAGFSYSGDSSYLISPVFDLTQVSNVQLSFQHKQPEWTGDPASELYVYYRASATEEWTQIASYTTYYEEFTLETLDLPNTSATYQICFKGVGASGYNVFLDDVTITGDEPVVEPCDAPTNVAVENGVVTWTGDAANYNVHIVAGETTIDTTVNTTSYTIEGLNNGDHATVTVQAICDEENLSDWSEAVEFDYIIDGINSYAIQANIFPNPTTGNVTVESNAINADINVFDMFGKLMMTSKVAAERTELNFSTFAPGVYMVRIANTTGTTTIKVVKE